MASKRTAPVGSPGGGGGGQSPPNAGDLLQVIEYYRDVVCKKAKEYFVNLVDDGDKEANPEEPPGSATVCYRFFLPNSDMATIR